MIIDCHMHVRKNSQNELDLVYCHKMLEVGDLLGIDIFCVSDLDLTGEPTFDQFHAANERVKQAISLFPDRYLGYCFINPKDPKALQEIIHRVRDDKFIGIKLYNQYFIDDPICEPILEIASEWKIPVLVHAGFLTHPNEKERQPHISNASHIIKAASHFPNAILIEGHIGGGGDWEWAIKHLREFPSVFIDTSGSGIDEWMLDRCVQELGVHRLLFGTDMSFEAGVGKILDATLSEQERRLIFGVNFQKILNQRNVY